MTNFIKISTVLGIFVVALFAFNAFSGTAFAWGTGDYGSGCCDSDNDGPAYSQSSYYNQGSYYSQSSYTTPAKCDLFTVNGASSVSLPAGGGNVTLVWATTNATGVSINQGVGSVAVDGSTVVAVSQNTTFTLTATGTGGNDSCTVTVTVPQSSAPTCDLFTVNGASSVSLPAGGGTVTLNWATTNATGVSIDQGVGSVAVDGSTSVTVTSNKTFVLTATNVAGATVNCSVSVTVGTNTYSQGSYGGGGGSSSPKCELKASDKKISRGQEVKLTWETSRATEVTLKDDHGKTLIDTDDVDKDDRKDFYDGDIKVRPTKDTTYTLTAEKGSKKRTCKVSVDVHGGVIVTEVRNQPLVAGIALTQVPYTGFDASPTLTFIFYTLLGLWALFIAYTLVLKKKLS